MLFRVDSHGAWKRIERKFRENFKTKMPISRLVLQLCHVLPMLCCSSTPWGQVKKAYRNLARREHPDKATRIGTSKARRPNRF